MDAIEQIFIEIWIRLTSDWSRLTTFRQMGMLGEDTAREAIHRSNTYFVQQQLVRGEYRNWLNDPESFIREGFDQKMPLAMTEQSVEDFVERCMLRPSSSPIQSSMQRSSTPFEYAP